MTLSDRALTDLLREHAIDRDMLRVALEQLHDAHIETQRLREQMAALRDEIRRYTREAVSA